MSMDLDDRLRSLGAHLDAERAAHVADNVTPHRRSRMWVAAAAVVLVLGGLLAITLTRPDAGDVTPGTDPPTTVASTAPATTTHTPPSSAAGELPLHVAYRFDDGSADPAPAIERIQQRADALGLSVTVTDDDPADDALAIVVHDVTSEESGAVTRAFLDLGDSVSARPVTKPCVTTGVPLEVHSDPSTEQLLPLLGDPTRGGCTVGKALANADIFQPTASVQTLDATTNVVVAELKPGADGQATWNVAATACYNRDTTCPTGQLAIEYGGWLYTAPTVQTPQFDGSVQFAGSFSEFEAKVLVDQINHGPAPFTVTPLTP